MEVSDGLKDHTPTEVLKVFWITWKFRLVVTEGCNDLFPKLPLEK